MRTAAFACVMTAAMHWLIAAHAPAMPPDVVAPAAVAVLVHSPLTTAVDALNGVSIGQDVALASWLVLVAVAGATALWTRRLGVAPWLAAALSVGVTFLPHAWSTQAPGRDGLVLLALVVLTRWVTGPPSTQATRSGDAAAATLALLLVAHRPATLWLLLPVALVVSRPSWRVRVGFAIAATLMAAAAMLVYASLAVTDASCAVDNGEWLASVRELLWPGVMPGAGSSGRLAQVSAMVVAELHVFGLAAAAWAVWLEGHAHPALRRVTVSGLAGATIATSLGAVSPGLTVVAAAVAWLPWFAIACDRLAAMVTARSRMLTRVAGMWLVVGLPLARHAVFVPDPLATGGPALWRAGYAQMDATVIAAATEHDARLARRADRALVAADAGPVGACLSRGQTVMAVGPAIDTLRHNGVIVDEVPLTVPLAALADDLRPGAVVALALTPEAARWLRPQAAARVAALGPHVDVAARRRAQATIVELPVPRMRGAADLSGHGASISRLENIGGRRLWHPLSVDAQPDAVRITAGDRAPQPVVLGDVAAVAVFDRTERPVIRASATAMPGLPMPLYSTLDALRLGRVVEMSPHRAVERPVLLLPSELPPPVDADTAATVPVHVGTGWHDAEPAGRLAFRWSAGRQATAHFRLAHATRLSIVLDASPARTAAHSNALRLLLNGVPVARDIDGARAVEVPASATRAGRNTLTFETDGVVPAGAIPGEPRTLAAVVGHLRVVRR